MDSGLRWTYHSNYLKNRINRFMKILKWMAESSWGINPFYVINFVNATIRGQIEWGAS